MLKTYNTQYTNILISGVIVTGLFNPIHTYNLSNNTETLQASYITSKQYNQNEIISVIETSKEVVSNMRFDFLQVDEKMDKQIDSYFATYTGKDIEILDL